MCSLQYFTFAVSLVWLSLCSVNCLTQIKTGKYGGIGVRDSIACSADTQPRVLTDPTGSFTSENYPSNYPDQANCSWLIVAQPGQIVRLDFEAFDTERGYDRVWLYDGNTEQAVILMGFDGSRSPPPSGIYSSQQYLLVTFSSDVTTSAAGFSATYTSVDPSGIEAACASLFRPLVLTDSDGLLTSPDFPSAYPFGLKCQWLIVSPEEDGFVKLDFTNFFTEPNADWVTIYDGDSSSTTLIASLSGAFATAPTGFQTTQRNMLVQFTSDLAVSVRGFNATFAAVFPSRRSAP